MSDPKIVEIDVSRPGDAARYDTHGKSARSVILKGAHLLKRDLEAVDYLVSIGAVANRGEAIRLSLHEWVTQQMKREDLLRILEAGGNSLGG